ncbi:MAG: NAD(P)/FAD-dependent oxidoreductase [Deltaproteobacteria bacterium]|nr:NAD(P)/FAD-dependent oxidoreductase [Deltaproteobacteria bacterium]
MSSFIDPYTFDVAIVGGGPAGLAAALALGRACRRVALFDAGPQRNAAASHLRNFVTRDGTPPSAFRQIAQEQLARYATVQLRADHVTSISGERDAFRLTTASGCFQTRRIVLCTGMVDEMLDLPGFRDAWGHSIFQCPYCHGWEVRDRRWGYLALNLDGLANGFPAMLKGWTEDLIVFAGPGVELPEDAVQGLVQRGIAFESSSVVGLVVEGQALTHVELSNGERIPCDVLFAHPPQRHVDLVQALELELDPQGYVQADPMTRQTSVPGIYAAGDLTTRAQGAIFAAAAGTQAGAMCNHDLCITVM